jgi:hypothetical protein
MKIIKTEKVGATRYATISCCKESDFESLGLRVKSVDGGVEVAYSNNSDYSRIVDAVDALNAPKPTNTTSVRRIALLDDCNGLSHGKSWIATLYDVDKNGLHPSYEGQSICFVYND